MRSSSLSVFRAVRSLRNARHAAGDGTGRIDFSPREKDRYDTATDRTLKWVRIGARIAS